MKSSIRIAVAIAAALLVTSAAEARTRHHYRHRVHTDRVVVTVASTNCDNNGRCQQTGGITRQVSPLTSRLDAALTRSADTAISFLSHPTGCPPIEFCACGAAVEVFGGNGRDHKSLWPARAWYGMPRASPAPGAVAVHSHHVFVLRSFISGDTWMVADYNSGGHRSRLQPHSISGWTIVRPVQRLASR